MPLLARRLLGVVADGVAAAPLAVTDRDLLVLEVVGHLLVATGPGHHLLRDLTTAVDQHAEDVLAAAPRERLEVGLRHHPGIPDEHAAAKLPALQVLLYPLDGSDVDGVARETPVTDLEAVAGHG